MFAVLAGFCLIFLLRAKRKGHPRAKLRAVIYAVSALGMFVSILLFVAAAVHDGESLVFWGETVGLVSFGISWLTASRVLPGITRPDERVALLATS